jgi:hypothetical protein
MSGRSSGLVLPFEVVVNDVEHSLPHRALAVDPLDRLAESVQVEAQAVRPALIVRTTTPSSSSTFTCFEIVGFDTPKPPVASPTVAEP